MKHLEMSTLSFLFAVGACLFLSWPSVGGTPGNSDTFLRVDRLCQPVPLYLRLNCIRRRYRMFDGTCNNLCNITEGSAETGFDRFLPPAFQNGDGPRLASSSGAPLKNARTISRNVFKSTSEDAGGKPPPFTHVTMTWGQFIDHDITLTESNETMGCGTNNEQCPTNVPGCISIPISQNNPDDRLVNNLTAQCIPLSRSALKDREQINLVSSYIDASMVYGANCEEAESLRDRKANIGALRVLPLPVRRSDRMPILPEASPESFCRSPRPAVRPCFLAGDFRRVNENPALMVMHTLLVREHNRIARFLHYLNPTWHDEKLFQEARKIVIAQIQHITYNEWLPVLFPSKTLRSNEGLLPEPSGQFFSGYDPTVRATTFNAFAAAALRMGHSLIRQTFGQFSKAFVRLGEISTTTFFNPDPLYILRNNGIDGISLGLTQEPSQQFDRNFVEAVRESLVIEGPAVEGVVGDLMAINIQRGRDHALPPYIQFRRACGLDKNLTGGLVTDFSQLTNIDPVQLGKIKQSYDSPADIDLFVGGVSERPQKGSIFGETFTCLIAPSFKRYRFGDRFWYERRDSYTGFTRRQLDSIRAGSSLARIICHNSDNVKELQRRVFETSTVTVPCDDIPSINLNLWREDAGMEDENPSAECEACSESKKKGLVMVPDDAISTDANTLTA